MERVFTSAVSKLINQKVLLKGWVHARRDHGKLVFFDLRDKDGLCQIVARPEKKEVYIAAKSLNIEDVVALEGIVRKRPAGLINPKIISGEVEVELSGSNPAFSNQ